MKELKTIKDIDESIPEGLALLVAIGVIGLHIKATKTPDQILEILNATVDDIIASKNKGEPL